MKQIFASAALLAMSFALPSQSAVIADNFTGGPYNDATTIGNGSGDVNARGYKAFGLTVGALALTFDSLDTIFDNDSFLFSRIVSGGIYSDVGGNPGTELSAFNDVFMPAFVQDVTLTSSTTLLLLPNTTYWFVLTGPVGVGLLPNWQTDVVNTAPTGSAYASVVGYRYSGDSLATWTTSDAHNQLRINATVSDVGIGVDTPEPSALVLSATGLLLAAGLFRRRR